jgi:hypothetical protein
MSEPNDIWTKVSYKRSRPTHEEGTQRKAKHLKESEYWLHPTSTSNRHTALLEEDNDQQEQKVDPANTPKSPPIYVSGINYLTSYSY